SSRRRHTRFSRDWSSDVCSSDLNGCGGCHTVRGTAATGQVGPDLTRFAERKRIAAGTAANTAENRKRFVRNPGGMKPGVLMPARSEERRVGKQRNSRQQEKTEGA